MTKIKIDIELIKTIYDIAVGSMDHGSGFLEKSDIEALAVVAGMIGADPRQAISGYEKVVPHLWHQDCAATYRCGKPAGHEIHRIELPS